MSGRTAIFGIFFHPTLKFVSDSFRLVVGKYPESPGFPALHTYVAGVEPPHPAISPATDLWAGGGRGPCPALQNQRKRFD